MGKAPSAVHIFKQKYLESQLVSFGQILCKALSGGAGVHKPFGRIALVLLLPWPHVAPIDL